MTAMTQAEIIDCSRWLENESLTTALRDVNNKYRGLYQLTEVPRLAQELTRGKMVVQPSSFMHKLSSAIIAQVTGYSTFPVFTATGGGITDWNEGQKLFRRVYRGLLNQTHIVLELKTGSPDEMMPCQLEAPRINTVFFNDFDAPGRPAVASRRFRMLIPDAVQAYSGKKGDHDGAGQALVLAGGKVSYQALSGERSVTEGWSNYSNGAGQAQQVEIVRVWRDGMVYDTLINLTGAKEQKVVFQAKTVTDGVPLVVVPCTVLDSDDPAENWRAGLWPAYMDTLQINRMRDIQATISERVMPHVFARMTPETQKLTRADGLAPLTQASEPGGPSVHRIYADDLVMYERTADPMMETREQRVINERDAYAQSWQLTVTPEMVEHGTRGANELHTQAVHQRETELLLPAAYGLAEGLRMAFCALANMDYENGYSIAAKDAVEYGDSRRIDKGTTVSLKRQTLRKLQVYGPKSNINIRVVTRSETEQELAAREQCVATNVARHVSAFPELIAVRYANVKKQQRVLAKDAAHQQLGAKYDVLQDEYATGRAQARFGQMWPGGGPAPVSNPLAGGQQQQGGGGIPPAQQGSSMADTQPGVADAMGAPA